jgi:hypothetical protein
LRFTAALSATVLLALGSLEIGARLLGVGEPQQNRRYMAISEGFPRRDQLVRDMLAGRTMYRDYQLHSGAPLSTPTINFTTYYSSRLTPDSVPRSQAKTIVWAFGGSTMQNAETTDDMTIANTVAKSFNAIGLNARVENFGVGSFHSSLEMVQFSRLLDAVPENERPSIAIFYDGFNDSQHSFLFGPGAIQHDLAAKVAMLVEGRSGLLAIYGMSSWLAGFSKAWAALVHPRLQWRLFRAAPVGGGDKNLEQAVSVYVRNIEMDDAICERFRIRCFFVLQPLVVTKTPLNAREQEAFDEIDPAFVRFARDFYDGARAQSMQRKNFIDLSGILNGRAKDDFYDFGHTSAFTSPVIGRAIAEQVLSRISVAASQAHAN